VTDRARVVVASPDEATRALVRLTLGEERYEVVDHDSLDAAVRGIVTATPQVLILDLALPVDALPLARTLRAQPETADIRTLVLVHRGAQAPTDADGVDATLVVPSTAFALLRKVDGLVDGG
jgi:DNA-binding response OmpR family regulator